MKDKEYWDEFYQSIIDDEFTKEVVELCKEMVSTLETRRCKFCGSHYVVKNGTFRGVQRWLCRNCGRAFVDNQALPKMKTPIPQIAGAVSMYYGGMSLNAIRRHLEQQYSNYPSDSAIYSWVTRFSKIAIDKAKGYIPNVGDVWIADETMLKIGGQKVWFWDIIDAKTRFLLASHMSTKRTTADALTLMKLAEKRAGGKIPELVFTDKLQAYTDGIELAFGADAKHIPSKGFVAPMNTNIIERFHGTLKDRTKVMRGFKSIKTAKLILDGWLVHYNFFRPHETLKGRTPAEKAGIKLPFRNWLDIVNSQLPSRRRKGLGKDKPPSVRASPVSAGAKRVRKIKPKGVKPRAQSAPMLKAIRT